MKLAFRWAILAGLAGACTSQGLDPQGDVLVSAAVSLTDGLQEVVRTYEQATGERVTLNLGPSNGLARQVLEGAPSDVFISADERQMQRVEDAGRVVSGGRLDLLTNQLAAVVAPSLTPVPESPSDLLRVGVRRVVIGDPAAVPAGVYARRYLESVGLWDQLEPKLVPVSSVRAALSAVENDVADVAFVYRTDARVAKAARLAFVVPLAEGPDIVYPLGLLENARNPDGARRFVDYLRGLQASRIFERYGFGVSHGAGGVAGPSSRGARVEP